MYNQIGSENNNFKYKIETLKDLNDFSRLFNEFKTKFQKNDSSLKLNDSFWYEIGSLIQSEKIKISTHLLIWKRISPSYLNETVYGINI